MNTPETPLTAQFLTTNASLVQTFEGTIWAISTKGVVRKLDFWPDAVGKKADLAQLIPYITAWRSNGNPSTYGTWHPVEVAS